MVNAAVSSINRLEIVIRGNESYNPNSNEFPKKERVIKHYGYLSLYRCIMLKLERA